MARNLLTFGKNLIAGNFERKSEPLIVDPGSWRGRAVFGGDNGGVTPDFFLGSNNVEYNFKWHDENSAVLAYENCPPVASIINRKAQADINGKVWFLNNKGKESVSPQAKSLKKLFARPNPLQTQAQFLAQQKIYTQLFGYSLVLPILPYGYTDYANATAFWNIPPFMVDATETNKLWYQTDMVGIIKEVVLTYKGTRTKLDASKLFIFRDITPSFNSMVFPDSRLRPLSYAVNNIIGAYRSENIIINRRGALGILSGDPGSSNSPYAPIPVTDAQKKQLQDEYRRYGLSKDQWQIIITSAALKWQRMSMTPAELGLHDSIDQNSMAICDAYGYPPHLLGLIDPTFNNQAEAQKSLYQDTIIPEANQNAEQWNEYLKLDDLNLSMSRDFGDVPCMQEDKKEWAEARKTLGEALIAEYDANLITYNRVLELLGEDPRGGYDKYKYELKEEFGIQDPNTLQNETGTEETDTAGNSGN